VIKMTMKEPMAAAPAGFSISNPPRIALDFPATANATGKAVQEVGDAVLRSLNIVQAGTRRASSSTWSRPELRDADQRP
jgi:type IV pilus assembly protein PilQ